MDSAATVAVAAICCYCCCCCCGCCFAAVVDVAFVYLVVRFCVFLFICVWLLLGQYFDGERLTVDQQQQE